MITTIYIPKVIRWCIVFGIIALGIDCTVSTIKSVLEVRSEYFTSQHDYSRPPETTLSQAQEELGELKALEESMREKD